MDRSRFAAAAVLLWLSGCGEEPDRVGPVEQPQPSYSAGAPDMSGCSPPSACGGSGTTAEQANEIHCQRTGECAGTFDSFGHPRTEGFVP